MELEDWIDRKVRLFWSRVQKSDGCWIWQGNTAKGGYGKMTVYKPVLATIQAHRFSFGLHNGFLPNDLNVCHTCDNPPCVNPAHLFVGTVEDNMQDMKIKDRHTWGDRSPNAKLTNEEAEEIRRRVASGESQASVRKDFDIAKSTISFVVNRKTY